MQNPAASACLSTAEDTLAYFDTVAIWIPRHLRVPERRMIKSLCGSMTQHLALRGARDRMWLHGYRVRLLLHQPKRELFQFLAQHLTTEPILINRVDCALDFIAANQLTADQMKEYVDRHWYKPYHRPQHTIEIYAGATTYLGFKNSAKKYVTYADRPSRHTEAPCCHVECRFQSKRAVAALGITSLSDLCNFDHKVFWKKFLRLYRYSAADLGKCWSGRHLNSVARIRDVKGFRYNTDARIGDTLLRALGTPDGADYPLLAQLLAAAKEWESRVKRFPHRVRAMQRVRDILEPIDITELLSKVRLVDPNDNGAKFPFRPSPVT
jgi:hypothetical protein